MIDEGYTKFNVEWSDRRTIDDPAIAELERWRQPLHAAGLVGVYTDLGIGFGNISMRVGNTRKFVISGTQTGHLQRTGNEHYALVTDYDIGRNFVSCRGAVQASSESLTHAAIYELDPAIRAVVHVHDLALWEELKNSAPTTQPEVAYGTPEMAREFTRLFECTEFAATGIAIMAGHESGIISIGASLEEAAVRILSEHARYTQQQQERS